MPRAENENVIQQSRRSVPIRRSAYGFFGYAAAEKLLPKSSGRLKQGAVRENQRIILARRAHPAGRNFRKGQLMKAQLTFRNVRESVLFLENWFCS